MPTALRNLLAHPLTKDLDIDDPRVTAARRQIIREKKPLRHIYAQWYGQIAAALPAVDGSVVELGSGAGFLGDVVNGVITTEVFPMSGVDAIADGRALPFRSGSLRALVMVDVLHHIPDVRRFLDEAQRSLRGGGRIVMVEPWVTTWARLIYRTLHHEPFEPDAAAWSFPESGPLSGANGALPWIVFQRDRAIFDRDYPQLVVREVNVLMPFRYLLTGGVSMRSVVPSFVFPLVSFAERLLSPFRNRLGMFGFVVVEKVRA